MTSHGNPPPSEGETHGASAHGALLAGPYWPEPVSIISLTQSPGDFVTVEAVGLRTQQHYTTTLPASAWAAVQVQTPTYTFDAPAQPFRLALEAERLRLAYTADPLLAANNARVHLLPHQLEAVYGYMLPQPRIRHLMAHDAGAGKTVMCGLLFRELASRESGLRTLIVAPAALTVQWQREMRSKFMADFSIVDRDELRKNPKLWAESPRLITSLPFARQADVIASLSGVRWDLVIVDEAHHMAGYERRETQAYTLGTVLSQNARHLVLATATPHKGDPQNFLKLLQLLDAGIFDPRIVSQSASSQRGTPLMLRRLKEEMVDFDGQLLFKPRRVETRFHSIADNPAEMDLYQALTEYVSKTYRAAEKLGGQVKVNTQFAMVMLQRRMASSFAALAVSLAHRREQLLHPTSGPGWELFWDELEELPEAERWARERQIELATPAQTLEERHREVEQVDRLLEMLEAVQRSAVQTKVAKLQEILAALKVVPGNGEKLLVFTEFKDTLDFLRRLFEGWGFGVTQIDGSMDQASRLQAESDFEHRDQVMVATEAAGEGINLQFCAKMVNYDLPWVPTRLEQRMGRIHRYGQKRVAEIVSLVAADTREGVVLVKMMERLDLMRRHLGDQVFDVVSELVGDVDLERLLAEVATAPVTQASQDQALHTLLAAFEAGEKRYAQWEEHPFPISPDEYRQLQQSSRQSRLTPEYAQHFFVDALTEMHEPAFAMPDAGQLPGDSPLFAVTLRRNAVAEPLGLAAHRRHLFSFHEEALQGQEGGQFLALGAERLDRMLALARERWGAALQQGAKFLDVALPPGAAYLLWFLSAEVRDGMGQPVACRLHAVKQTPDGCEGAPGSALIDLVPAPDTFLVPAHLRQLAQSPQPVLDWSIREQLLRFLGEVQQQRLQITRLRREPLLADAEACLQEANRAYSEAAFAALDADPQALQRRGAQVAAVKDRIAALLHQFEHEGACSLGPVRVVGAAAVFSLVEPPDEALADERPSIAAAAMGLAMHYEAGRGRHAADVSGEHDQYPYDLHSSGPGGVRCIEVKGTTTGKVLLSDNERRAAGRLRESYYLYVVSNPLGEQPTLTIIRDPLAHMSHDDVLYGSARYLYNASTWRGAADEEISL